MPHRIRISGPRNRAAITLKRVIAAAAFCALPGSVQAQWRSQLDLGSLVRRDGAGETLTAPMYVSGRVEHMGRVGRFDASGFYSDGSTRSQREQRLAAEVESPRLFGLALGVGALRSSVRIPSQSSSDRTAFSLAPSLRVRRFAAGARIVRSRFGTGYDVPDARDLASSFAYDFGHVTLGISRRDVSYRETIVVSRDSVIMVAGFPFHTTTEQFDISRRGYRDAEASLDVRLARTVLMMRAGTRNAAYSGRERWTSVAVDAPLTRRTRVVAELANAASVPEQHLPSHPFVRIGLQLLPQASGAREVTERARDGERHEASVEVLAGASGRALRVRNVRAARLELMGDISDWQPVELVRDGASGWRFDGPIEPGIHHLLMRIDGGAWRAPPSLPTVESEFGQTVGLLVVER